VICPYKYKLRPILQTWNSQLEGRISEWKQLVDFSGRPGEKLFQAFFQPSGWMSIGETLSDVMSGTMYSNASDQVKVSKIMQAPLFYFRVNLTLPQNKKHKLHRQ
jgi:hypothetical protein